METIFETDDALTKKVWDETLFRETCPETYWNKFFGKTASAAVHEKTQLTKDQGDTITFGLIPRLTGDGVTGDDQLEGNEEALQHHSDSVSLQQYRHGVEIKGRLSRQRPAFLITDEARTALKQWGVEKIDKLCFSAIEDAPKLVAYRNSAGAFLKTTTPATASGAVHADNSKLTLNFIPFLKTIARTGNDRAFTPIRPVKINGKEYYVFLVYEDTLYDLKTDSAFQQAMREAQERGNENPLFSGATAIYDGVVIHAHEFVSHPATGGAGGNVRYSKGSFFGAQALCWAWGMRPEVVMDEKDYKNKIGWAWSLIAGVKKPVFNTQAFGSFGVYLSHTNVSG